MFLTGPAGRARGDGRGGQRRTSSAGPSVHERNGVCHLVAADDPRRPRSRASCSATCRSTRRRRAALARAGEPAGGADPGAAVPAEPRKVYDVRDVDRARSSTAARLLEIQPRWARNIVTGFARIEGRAGRRDRQPAAPPRRRDRRRGLARRARVRRPLRRFGLPLVVLVDTPGFMPGTRQERGGRDPLRRRAAARVRGGDGAALTVVLRKAYGGAFITMNSKDLGADLVFAWPQAEIGVMGARRRSGSSTGASWRRRRTPRRAGASSRAALRGASTSARDAAAAAGFVDEVIEPAETRPGSPGPRAMERSAATGDHRRAGPTGRGRFVALGDSFTAGTGCPPGERWADRVAALAPPARPARRSTEPGRGRRHQFTTCSSSSGRALQLRPSSSPSSAAQTTSSTAAATRSPSPATSSAILGRPAARAAHRPRGHRHGPRALGLPCRSAAHPERGWSSRSCA